MGSNHGSTMTLAGVTQLNDGDWLTSPLGFCTLTLQSGALILVRTNNPSTVLWQSGATIHPGAVCILEKGGVVAITPPGGSVYPNPDYWDSPTITHPHASLVVTDDGHVMIFDSQGNLIWVEPAATAAPAIAMSLKEALDLTGQLQTTLLKTKALVEALPHTSSHETYPNGSFSPQEASSDVKLTSKGIAEKTGT